MEFKVTLLKADTPDSNGRVYTKDALKKAVEEYNKSHDSSTAVPEHKTRVKIDMESYHKNIPCGHIYDEYLANGSWAKGVQWYEYDVTPEELKDMIDKCVNVSSDFDITWNDKFEVEVNKEMLNKIYKHDEDGERMYRTMQPYLIPIDLDTIRKYTRTKLSDDELLNIATDTPKETFRCENLKTTSLDELGDNLQELVDKLSKEA